ncbi:hypothetical protein V6N13_048340 [Hibiscus sabdariffa]
MRLGRDLPGWRWEQDRRFSTKSAYASLVVEASNVSPFNWKLIWSLKFPQCVKMFLWLVAHQRLLTNAERCRQHLSSSDLCSIFNQDSETVDHVLRISEVLVLLHMHERIGQPGFQLFVGFFGNVVVVRYLMKILLGKLTCLGFASAFD